jgi:hypothetical protein
VKELLRLAHELGYSKRQIALSIRMPKTTVGDYLARAEAAGLGYADVAEMSEEAVEALLFQRAELPGQRPMPDWGWVSGQSHMKNPVGGSMQRNPCYEQRNLPTRVPLRSGTLDPS